MWKSDNTVKLLIIVVPSRFLSNLLIFTYRVDRGYLSHILFQDFCIFLHSHLERLWYVNVLSEPLATIELWQLSPYPGQVVTPHSIALRVISKLSWTKILVYSSALQSKKVQSSVENIHLSKKLRKTENFSLNLNIRVLLESVKHVRLWHQGQKCD